MKAFRPRRRIIRALLLFAGVALLHLALIRWAQARNVAAAILSGGPHTPAADLILAVGLLAVRLVLILLMPALLLREIVVVFLASLAAKQRNSRRRKVIKQCA